MLEVCREIGKGMKIFEVANCDHKEKQKNNMYLPLVYNGWCIEK